MNWKHGKKDTRAYNIWAGIKSRCQNPNEPAYKNYGGRGITLCSRWQDFRNFYADMGDPPEGRSIERVDNSRGYEPGNCVWATRSEQNRNKRGLRYITIDGETLPLAAWVERIGAVSYSTAHMRIRSGMDALTAITLPKVTRRLGVPFGKRIAGYNSDPIVQTSEGPMPLWRVIQRSSIDQKTIYKRLKRGWSVEAAVSLSPRKGPRKERFGAEHGVVFGDEKREQAA
jgi:hypothetical protein